MSGNLLSGIKIIPRDELDAGFDETSISPDSKNRKSSSKGKEKRRSAKHKSSDDELVQIDKRKKKKKWYSSDEYSNSSTGSETEISNSEDDAKRKSRKRKKKSKKSKWKRSSSLENELGESVSDGEGYSAKEGRSGGKGKKKTAKSKGSKDAFEGIDSKNSKDDKRKEMGLDWMLRPKEAEEGKAEAINHEELEEPQGEEVIKVNPRELNPYLNDGNGYPDEVDGGAKTTSSQLLSTSVIGDGGASWRLKALKRAQEQAAREGRRVEEVVGERWGSLSQLSIPAKVRAAPSRAHLHAIKNRQKGVGEETQTTSYEAKDEEDRQTGRREYLKDVSVRHPEMKAPKIHDSLSWGKRRGQNTSNCDVRHQKTANAVIDRPHKLENQEDTKPESASKSDLLQNFKDEPALLEIRGASEINASQKHTMSANQLAAKALQLRMKGKNEEAEELQREVERRKQSSNENPTRMQSTSRYIVLDKSLQGRKDESDDMHLAQTIMQNKKFSVSGQADDEYDYDGAPQRKSKKKGGDHNPAESTQFAQRIMTQQERCQFCFENPNRPKHLVLSIANYTYLMLPQRQPVVDGHCCIVTMQHDSATRSVDNNVWDEIRNFKKCLIMMFGKQEKDVVFIETVMGLAQRRRHCLVECIPLPQDIARQAPLYFKKAIDEAEDEWSQHNAKKLIDTSKKGLRGSIPKDFPYFYVEFGLDKGFVHVIDDEKQFNANIGLNVIRGMLQLADEDMYRRRRHESVDAQKKAKLSFMQDWQTFDWTKQLE
ncbi:hypothetical protein QQ045_032169 [Rhodiola kirilowii]